jgi:hypothetical protein
MVSYIALIIGDEKGKKYLSYERAMGGAQSHDGSYGQFDWEALSSGERYR